MTQDHIAQQDDRQQQPVQRQQRDKPERAGQGRNRQPGPYGDDDDGSDDQRPTGPALDEWNLVGADGVDNQCLGKERDSTNQPKEIFYWLNSSLAQASAT